MRRVDGVKKVLGVGDGVNLTDGRRLMRRDDGLEKAGVGVGPSLTKTTRRCEAHRAAVPPPAITAS
jgi:hypothetical protein